MMTGKTCAAAKLPNFNYGTLSLIFMTKTLWNYFVHK